MKIKKMGQVFTPNNIARKMINLYSKNIKNRDLAILEPSVGEGIFYDSIFEVNKNIIGIEIDYELAKRNRNIIHSDYFEYINKNNGKFDLIIGNPPYVDFKNIDHKVKENIQKNKLCLKNRPNLYQYFLLSSMKALNKNGEIIFIVPADVFLKTSSKEIVALVKKEFSILHYEIVDENIWSNASVTTAIIKLVKKVNHKHKINYFINNSKIFFNINGCIKLPGYMTVKVGGVPKNKINAKSKTGIEFIHSKTATNGTLIKYDYNEKKWIRPVPKKPEGATHKIFINSKTRNKRPFFSSDIDYYDGSVLCIYFKNPWNIKAVLDNLNSINWENISLKRNGRLILSQSILVSLFCNE